jgi:hypothetical protein
LDLLSWQNGVLFVLMMFPLSRHLLASTNKSVDINVSGSIDVELGRFSVLNQAKKRIVKARFFRKIAKKGQTTRQAVGFLCEVSLTKTVFGTFKILPKVPKTEQTQTLAQIYFVNIYVIKVDINIIFWEKVYYFL